MRKRYRQVKQDGKYVLVDVTEWKPQKRKAPFVQGDLPAYAPVAGKEAVKILTGAKDAKLIDGRKAHREYLKRNNLVEVGNEMRPFVEYSGKTRENHEYWSNRTYKGVPIRPAKGRWLSPDMKRLEK